MKKHLIFSKENVKSWLQGSFHSLPPLPVQRVGKYRAAEWKEVAEGCSQWGHAGTPLSAGWEEGRCLPLSAARSGLMTPHF